MPNIKYNFRVWRITNMDGDGNGKHSDKFYVETPQEGARLIHALSRLDLQTRDVVSNAFGMEEYVDGEWMEWENDEGDDIDDLVNEYEAYLNVAKRK